MALLSTVAYHIGTCTVVGVAPRTWFRRHRPMEHASSVWRLVVGAMQGCLWTHGVCLVLHVVTWHTAHTQSRRTEGIGVGLRDEARAGPSQGQGDAVCLLRWQQNACKSTLCPAITTEPCRYAYSRSNVAR